MSRSKFWSVSHSTARIALATTAVATLAIIGACSEGGVASSVTSPSVRLGVTQLPGIANATKATVCVSSTSPDGTYTFVNSSTNLQLATGASTANAPDGVPYSLIKNVGNPNPCVDVLTRGALLDPNALSDFPQMVTTVTNTGTPTGVVYVSTDCVDDAGVVPSICGNPSTINANKFHGSRATFNFGIAPCVTNCIATPQFVVGDLASGLQLAASLKGSNSNTLNFWGSQWWKNNPTSLVSTNGYPSFKGYATTADNFCGGDWTSRVGNSPPPPATIGAVITVIVTDQVLKNGPDFAGKIRQIILVAQDGGYGPNPGHDGNGPLVTTLCGGNLN